MRGLRTSSTIGVLALVAVCCAAPASAQAGAGAWTVRAPHGKLAATVTASADGRLWLSVADGRAAVVERSPLGLTTTAGDYTAGMRLTDRDDRRIGVGYATTTGKRLRHADTARELTLEFATATGSEIALDVRVFDDGVGYRYRLPDRGAVTVTGEASGFRIPAGSAAWLLPYSTNYEEIWRQATVGEATGEYGLAPIFEVAGGHWLQLGETSTYDGRYAGAHLSVSAADPTLFRYALAGTVTTSGPLATPWRTAAIGDLDDVVESDLVLDLAPPSRIRDTSWIEPGRAAWSWWSESDSPGDFERQKEFVDYASEHGWEYVLVDAGWSAEWVPELVRYAAARGVDILLWAHWERDLGTVAQRETNLPLWKSWGVAGVKIDFMESDSQARMQWYDDVLQRTAALELMVSFHGSTLPRGFQRTWPHVMTLESVRGAEWYKCRPENWGVPCDLTPEHNAILPFTRNADGSMDYTPVTFTAVDRTTSAGHELGLAVVVESGWQHFADSPESYASRPLAEAFLDQVPTAWDETRLVGGRPGELAIVARRAGGRWFVGSIAAGGARTVELPLRFLGGGRYVAEVYRDAGDDGLARDRALVTKRDTLTVPVAENGGFAVAIGGR